MPLTRVGPDRQIEAAEFAALMAPLGPFEPRPNLAVAVSGGADSLGLCLLAQEWVRDRGGTITALTVDHRLRPESANEAATVGGWMVGRAVPHEILPWRDAPSGAVAAAAARAARHRLLERWCTERSVAHLLMAHTREDQAETVLLRLAKGSGVDGMAGMAAVRETAGPRLLRPLLGVPKARLRATCKRFAQPWVEDPSNADPRFARARLRQTMTSLAREGLTVARLAEAAGRAGALRAACDAAVADCLTRAAVVHPEGYLTLDWAVLADAPREIGRRALANALLTVGGQPYAPRWRRLVRLDDALRGGAVRRGRTLAGCRIIAAGRRLTICREPGAIRERLPLRPGGSVWWDRRFRIALAPDCPQEAAADLEVGPVGPLGRADRAGLPAVAASGLPGLWRVGFLGPCRIDARQAAPISDILPHLQVAFAPARPLAGAPFGVV